jgi:hypothetical protein
MVSNASTSGVSGTTSTKTKGILSLVFGIISIALCLFLPIVWLFFGVAAVVLGFLSRKSEPAAQKLALWGIILGFVGIALNIASMVIGAIIMAQLMGGGA